MDLRKDQVPIGGLDLKNIGVALDDLEVAALAKGYKKVDKLENLSLSKEERASFQRPLQVKSTSTRYYIAERRDGEKVKAVIRAKADGTYFAEFISTTRRISKPDLSIPEIEDQMELLLALEPPKDQSK